MFNSKIENLTRIYYNTIIPGYPVECKVGGESVIFELSQDRKTLVKKKWITKWPEKINTSNRNIFCYANINGQELLASLLILPNFSQEDFVELTRSEIPEVRLLANSSLKDETLLKVIEPLYSTIRDDIVRKSVNQGLLAKLISGKEDLYIRIGTLRWLTDQGLLFKLANDASEFDLRFAAINYITDQAMLVKLAYENEDSALRYAAINKIKEIKLLYEVENHYRLFNMDF